jgi:hypothetical protein
MGTNAVTTGPLNSGIEPLFARVCGAGALFFDDVAQQVLLAQQPG